MTQESLPKTAPYTDVYSSELILRDHLAVHRTVLANERTLLAYVRTALTLFLVGVSFVHLPDLHPDPDFGGSVYDIAGWSFVAAAVSVLVVGYIRYRQFRAKILRHQQPL